MDRNSRPGVHQVAPGRARTCSYVLWLAWILPQKSRHDSPQIQHTLFARDLPIVCQFAARAFRIQARTEVISTRSRDRTVAASTLSLFTASCEEIIPAVFRAAGTAPAKRGIQGWMTQLLRLRRALQSARGHPPLPAADRHRELPRSLAVNRRFTPPARQIFHPARCGPDARACIELRFITDGAAEEHCSTIGVVPPQLAIHVGTLVDQRIQVSTSPLATIACDWRSGWAWTTCDFAASKRANAAGQLLKRPAAQFSPLPCRRLGHPAGNRLYERPPRATSDSRALVTSVPGRSRICALVKGCNGRLGRNCEMPDEFSTLSLLAGSHQGLCPTCHGVLPAGHRRCCP